MLQAVHLGGIPRPTERPVLPPVQLRVAPRVARLAVASGKGGTGKTIMATNLARALADRGGRVVYLDCDVEAPNGHVFLTPSIEDSTEASVRVAEIDADLCRACGACARACRFGAVLALAEASVVFPDLCHGCGGCIQVCPTGAMREVRRPVGIVEIGHSGRLGVCQGRLDVGRIAEHEVVRAVRAAAPVAEADWVIMDAPAGVGCPVVETVRDADLALLVTEPTPAGLHDLALAVELSRDLGVPCAVVVNRAGSCDTATKAYCAEEGIPILAELPDDLRIARTYARGQLLVDVDPNLRAVFERLAMDLADLLRALPSGPPGAPSTVDRQPPVQIGLRDPAPPRPSDLVEEHTPSSLREIVLLSGKGGTGKTSIAACLASLAENAVAVDADVDAANLHLLLDPTPEGTWPFSGGQVAAVDPTRCVGCGLCADACRFDALRVESVSENGEPVGLVCVVDPAACEGCGVCVDSCPEAAVDLVPSHSGTWSLGTAQLGPLVHARLQPGRRNSGKLVTLVRDQGRAQGRIQGRSLMVTDGPPGIGCPTIASLTGADHVLLVSEPTTTGLHDLRRVLDLAGRIGVPAAVCINKVDLHPGLTAQIDVEAAYLGVPVLGRIRYDESVVRAHRAGRCVVDHAPDSPAARDVRDLWRRLGAWIEGQPSRSEVTP